MSAHGGLGPWGARPVEERYWLFDNWVLSTDFGKALYITDEQGEVQRTVELPNGPDEAYLVREDLLIGIDYTDLFAWDLDGEEATQRWTMAGGWRVVHDPVVFNQDRFVVLVLRASFPRSRARKDF